MAQHKMPSALPVIELASKFMVFPGNASWIAINADAEGNNLFADLLTNKHPYALAIMSDPVLEKTPNKFFKIGVVCKTQIIEGGGLKKINLIGMYRVKVVSYFKADPQNYWMCDYIKYNDQPNDFFVKYKKDLLLKTKYHPLVRSFRLEIRLLVGELAMAIDRTEGHLSNEAIEFYNIWQNIDKFNFYFHSSINNLLWKIIHMLPEANNYEKQTILNSDDLMQRIQLILKLLSEILQIYVNQDKMDAELMDDPAGDEHYHVTETKPGKVQITNGSEPDELSNSRNPEIAKRYKRYREIEQTINPEGRTAIIESFKHLQVIGSSGRSSADWSTHLNYIDTLLALYSCVTSPQETDISKVEDNLGPSHYGMDTIKERIYNYLTATILNPRGKGPTLCFTGPPGVGKTSIGKSIADSLGRKFIRLSLGGVKDEAEIRGHRRTYIGAVPGKIIEQLKRSGVKNPVFMLDEIDKISMDSRDDPAAALLEVLDPEQNHSFRDHYVDAPFDLSEVLFLCTANLANNIPPALIDRLEIIPIAGYTEFEKIQIAKKYLLQDQIIETGFPAKKVKLMWPDDNPDIVLSKLISGYTREAGVRGLKREIYRFLSAWNRKYLKTDIAKRPTELLMTDGLLEELLGLAKDHEQATLPELGEAIGLAWTEVGGEIIRVQSKIYDYQKFSVLQTGLQGKVMEEAGQVAISLLRDELEKLKEAKSLNNKFIHIHIPEGSIPKDGPSAGITTVCSLYSASRKKAINPYIAMTGEITLTGKVTAVGGIKEKILAAQRAGIKEVILPTKNKRDIDKDIPVEIKDQLKFYFVEHINEVIKICFN